MNVPPPSWGLSCFGFGFYTDCAPDGAGGGHGYGRMMNDGRKGVRRGQNIGLAYRILLLHHKGCQFKDCLFCGTDAFWRRSLLSSLTSGTKRCNTERPIHESVNAEDRRVFEFADQRDWHPRRGSRLDSGFHHGTIESLAELAGVRVDKVQRTSRCCVRIDGSPIPQVAGGFNDYVHRWPVLGGYSELPLRHRNRWIKLDAADHAAIGVELRDSVTAQAVHTSEISTSQDRADRLHRDRKDICQEIFFPSQPCVEGRIEGAIGIQPRDSARIDAREAGRVSPDEEAACPIISIPTIAELLTHPEEARLGVGERVGHYNVNGPEFCAVASQGLPVRRRQRVGELHRVVV